MKAKFGPGGNDELFYSEGNKKTIEAPEWLRKKGLDAYEYEGGNGITASLATLSQIGEKAKENNIKVSLHAPYYISLSSESEEIREKSVERIIKSAEAAKALSAEVMVVHTGSAAKISRETAMEYAAQTITSALDRINAYNVKIGLETMGKINQLGTLDEVLRLCKISPKLCPVVDFGHMNARENGLFVSAEDYKRLFEKIAVELGAEYAENLHCHFSKVEYTKMGEKKHLTFDDTTFGPEFPPLAEAIVSLGVAPVIICESAGTMASDALTMKKIYESYYNA